MRFSLQPLTATIGAELVGLDLRNPLDPESIASIRGALLEHLVLFIRDQDISPADQHRFCSYFGPVLPSIGRRNSDEVHGVSVLDQVHPVGQGGDEWHSDHMFSPEPPLGTVLRAVQLPSVGGDTCFVNMVAAYEALSPPLQAFLDGLSAVNSNERTVARIKNLGIYENDFDREPPHRATHPIVRLHPETGHRSLYVSPRDTLRICELSPRESEGLLSLLFQHFQSPDFQCRFQWQTNSIAFWDNRVVQHRAIPDYRERRLMHRVMIGDTSPVRGARREGARPTSGRESHHRHRDADR